jgi:cold shock protein
MLTGTIAFYDAAREFGFVKRDDGGADVFVHRRSLVNTSILKKGDRVHFDVVDDRGGKLRAKDVRLVAASANEI